MRDPEALAVARRAFSAHLIRWPELVAARGEEGAAVRLEWWQRRVQQLEDASDDRT